MTWLAELKPNTALNHRGVVDGSRERKGARRQRFLIQINTQPRLSSAPLLSNIDCSNSQWLFQHSLGKRPLQIHVPPPPNPPKTPLFQTIFPYFLLLSRTPFFFFPLPVAIHLFPSHLAFPEPSFHGPFIDSLPLRHLPWSPGSSFLVAQKTSVTDCLPPVRL